MKIVFSRKGFDSSAGGYPSLIFPDGSLFSIPIPSTNDKYMYKQLEASYEGEPIQSILNDLSNNQIRCKKWLQCDYANGEQFCHHDPMPYSQSDFKGIALGQVDAAESHLRNQGVGTGDLFIFYGWFRRVSKNDGTWSYIRNQPDVHLIWSYMSIRDVIQLDTNDQQDTALDKYPFLHTHPHMGEQGIQRNSIYISDEYRYFQYQQNRCLTDMKKYKGRATWRLPRIFDHPEAFSYLKNFTSDKNEVVISYRGYGQEFVLNLDNVKSIQDRDGILSYVQEITKTE